ncbi:MAG: mannonate dehydratase [Hyphomicrobiaceae bacterium]|nr:mannonate dehydratase [Hyphomicrobiaceae bacterium]
MRDTWRWFGPADPVSMTEIEQTGVREVVSALHQVPPGQVWTSKDIAHRQSAVRFREDGSDRQIAWTVVESLPVSEAIKKQSGDWRTHIAAYAESLRNLGAAGLRTVCYNFMPVLDWTRTDLKFRLATGATCMQFDWIDFAAFDLFVLRRAGSDYDELIRERARQRRIDFGEAYLRRVTNAVLFGLPGETEALSPDGVLELIAQYRDIGAESLKRHHYDFLEQVVPVAEEAGISLCCHPDDPPFSLLGLPRVMSTEQDYSELAEAVNSRAAGITFCTGSLGARSDNDLVGMVRRLGNRFHFVHLRNVRRANGSRQTPPGGSFHESGHVEGDVPFAGVISALLDEEKRRRAEGRTDWNLPFRSDHGLDLFEDQLRGGQPGYPLIGRLVGLSEIRGILAAAGASDNG